MRKTSMFFALLIGVFLTSTAWAQERIISGRVVGSDDQLPLPQVSVFLKGTTSGVPTDSEGNYRFSVPQSGGVLVFRYIGYVTQEVTIGNQSVINVQLVPDVNVLQEVIVLGYGQGIEKKEVTGAITSIEADKIAKLPVQGFDQALQGRAAGVLIQSANGIPGAAPRVRIRGQGSINAGNAPLYVVDGIQLNTADNAASTDANPLNSINPADIESIQVLKDAAAASLYGSQGANGVVLITTKRGKAGKAKVRISHYSGFVDPFTPVDVLNTQQFIQTEQEARTALFEDFGLTISEADARAFALGRAGLDAGLTPEQIAALPTFDRQSDIFRRGFQQSTDFTISGGSDQTQYLFSGSYNNSDGNVLDFDFERITARMNLTTKVSDKLKLSNTLNYATVKQQNGLNNGLFFENLVFASTVIPPTVSFIREDGSFLPSDEVPGIIPRNLLEIPSFRDRTSTTNSITGSVKLDYNPIEALTITGQFNVDYRTVKDISFTSPQSPDADDVSGRVTNIFNENLNWSAFGTASYNFSIDRNNFTVLAGAEFRQEDFSTFTAGGTGLPSSLFTNVGSTAVPETVTGNEFSFKRAGIFGRINYDFDKRFFFTFSGRYDGSSRFGDNTRFGFFPSVSGQWAVSNEDFFPKSRVVTDLRVRASWGQLGNDQIGNFQNITNFSSGVAYNGISGLVPTNIGNNNLEWERNETINVGIDVNLFNTLDLTVEGFIRDSKNLLLARPLPQSSGFGSITENVGAVRNQGIEINLGGEIFDFNGFKFNADFNVAFLDNEVLELIDGLQVLDETVTTQVRVGDPLFTFVTRDYAGVNAANGRPFWYDNNGNLTYNPILTPGDNDDRRVVGDSFADVFGGVNLGFSYKGFELRGFFQYEFGKDAIATARQFNSELGRRLLNGRQDVFNEAWRAPGDVTSVPRIIQGGAFRFTAQNTALSSRFIEDASYVRLKNLVIAYNFQQSVLNALGFSNLRVYAQGANLFTITEFDGVDPEFSGVSNPGIIPVSRSFTFGVELSF